MLFCLPQLAHPSSLSSLTGGLTPVHAHRSLSFAMENYETLGTIGEGCAPALHACESPATDDSPASLTVTMVCAAVPTVSCSRRGTRKLARSLR